MSAGAGSYVAPRGPGLCLDSGEFIPAAELNRPRYAELLELLRQASPPFGCTAEKREQWKRRKDEVLNQQ